MECCSFAVIAAVAGVYSRDCAQRVCGDGCTVSSWLRGRGRKRRTAWNARSSEREDFEQIIAFLAAVPLFKKLPRAELPKVASALRRLTWQPGDKVIEQGREGKAFFVIESGEAQVLLEDANGERKVLATLYHADYFGGHTLCERRPNVATIVAAGRTPLVTLSMSREEFARLGLQKQLRFPARPAVYEGRHIFDGQRTKEAAQDANQPAVVSTRSLTPEEEAFICKAVHENCNLRAHGARDPDAVRQMARAAQLLRVEEGTELLQGGEIGHAFYVIAEGAFDLLPADSTGHGSMEARIAKGAVTERLARKQQFLMGVLRHQASLHRPVSDGSSLSEMGSPVVPVASLSHTMSKSPTDAPLATGEGGLPRRPSTTGVGSQSVSLPMHTNSGSPPRPTSWAARSHPGEFHAGAPDRYAAARWYRSYSEGGDRVWGEGSPFKIGDEVARVVAAGGLVEEVGTVLQVVEPGPEGEVLVLFPGSDRPVRAAVLSLRPVEDQEPLAKLLPGECIGELALLYNTRSLAACRAAQASAVYAIPRRAFKECFNRETTQFREFCNLLDQVPSLATRLRSERAELARNSAGLLSFKRGELVLSSGQLPSTRLWYIVDRGGGTMREGSRTTELRRGSCFGAFDAFDGQGTSEVSVEAGVAGMTCLVFEAELLRHLPGFVQEEQGVAPALSPDRSISMPLRHYSFSLVPIEALEVVALLGEGGFGSVLLVRHESVEYALKRISKGYITEQDMTKQICAERDILSMVDSPFVVRFIRSYKDAQYLYMLMEFVSGGHLYTLMCDQPEILEQDYPRGSSTMFYAACVCLALEHLHERNIVYRDLKPENVLLDSRGYAKICDLGFARFVLGKTSTIVGTPEYMSPEMIDSPHAHDAGVDWWSLGVLVFELLAGQVPFSAADVDDPVIVKLLTIRRGQDAGVPEKLLPSGLILARDFVHKLLMVREEARLGYDGDGAEVRRHPWFAYQKFDFCALREGKYPSPHRSSKKIVERMLTTGTLVESLGEDKLRSDLFVPYVDDKTGWDDPF